MEIDFSKIDEIPAGADRFFKTFCRFEFAMKEHGLHLIGAQSQVHPCWHCLAKQLGEEFFEEIQRSGNASTIRSKPPKVQVVKDGALDFDPIAPPKNTQQLLEAVCRARANLFHGGKSGDPDADRNTSLIAEAQWLLEHVLSVQADLRCYFEGRY